MWSVLNSAPRAADKAFQHVMKALTPAVGSTVRPGDADQGKLLREHFAARKIVKCRYHQTLGQIAGGAKDDQRAGIGRFSLVLGWARYQLCARWSSDRCLVKHGGAVSSSSQSSDKYAHHGEYQYAISAGGALSLYQREGIASFRAFGSSTTLCLPMVLRRYSATSQTER